MTPRNPTGGDDDEWENSGVHESPPAPRASTSPGAYGAARGSLGPPNSDGRATARKALAMIGDLGKRFDAHSAEITRRFEEHAREDREQFKRIDQKLDEQGGLIGGLRETTAAGVATSQAVKETLAGLTSELRLAREVQAKRELLERTAEVKLQVTEREAEIEDKQQTRAHKRTLVLEWNKVITAILIAGASALITAFATGKL